MGHPNPDLATTLADPVRILDEWAVFPAEQHQEDRAEGSHDGHAKVGSPSSII